MPGKSETTALVKALLVLSEFMLGTLLAWVALTPHDEGDTGSRRTALSSSRHLQLPALQVEVDRAEDTAVDRESPLLVGYEAHGEGVPGGHRLHPVLQIVDHLEPHRLLERVAHGDRHIRAFLDVHDRPALGRRAMGHAF